MPPAVCWPCLIGSLCSDFLGGVKCMFSPWARGAGAAARPPLSPEPLHSRPCCAPSSLSSQFVEGTGRFSCRAHRPLGCTWLLASVTLLVPLFLSCEPMLFPSASSVVGFFCFTLEFQPWLFNLTCWYSSRGWRGRGRVAMLH